METFELDINGEKKTATVEPSTPLLWVLRDSLQLTGTKYGCGIGACGACTVHLDGVASRACLVPVSLVGARRITTIEGVAKDAIGAEVQRSWIETDVVQCGYCQSGQIMTAVALLKSTPAPSDAEVEQSMGGTLCRCGTYVRIRAAVRLAASRVKP